MLWSVGLWKYSKVVNPTDSGARLPRFSPLLCLLGKLLDFSGPQHHRCKIEMIISLKLLQGLLE